MQEKGVFLLDLVRYIISFLMILLSSDAHQQCYVVRMCSKQSRVFFPVLIVDIEL